MRDIFLNVLLVLSHLMLKEYLRKLSSPFYRWGKWSSERLKKFINVTQIVSNRAEHRTPKFLLWSPCSYPCQYSFLSLHAGSQAFSTLELRKILSLPTQFPTLPLRFFEAHGYIRCCQKIICLDFCDVESGRMKKIIKRSRTRGWYFWEIWHKTNIV